MNATTGQLKRSLKQGFLLLSHWRPVLAWLLATNILNALPTIASAQQASPQSRLLIEQVAEISGSETDSPKVVYRKLLNLRENVKRDHLEGDSANLYLLQKIGKTCLLLGDLPAAIDFTRQSIRVAGDCMANRSCNARALVDNYYNLYYYFTETGDLDNKFSAIDSCIRYVSMSNYGFDLAVAMLADRADFLFNKGDYSQCYADARAGENMLARYDGGPYRVLYIALFVNKQAHYLYYSKRPEETEKLLSRHIAEFERNGHHNEAYAFYTVQGLLLRDKKKYERAIEYFQKGFRACLNIKHYPGCAQNLAEIGITLARNAARPEDGLRYCKDALKYAGGADSVNILTQSGAILASRGMFRESAERFRQAFMAAKPGLDETNILQHSFQNPVFNLLQYLSDLLTEMGDAAIRHYYRTKDLHFLKNALSIYKTGDAFLAKIRNEQQLQMGSNLIWRITARRLYEHAIEACYVNNNIEDAFYFFEKSRAVLLNDQINEQRWMADDDIAKQAAIKKNIVETEAHLAALPVNSKDYLAIQNQLTTRSQELAALMKNIKKKNPQFYQNYFDTVFISVGRFKKDFLKTSGTLVEIFYGDSAVYILNLSPLKNSLTKLNKELYDSLTSTFNGLIVDPQSLKKNFNLFIASANDLFNLIFEKNIPPAGTMIISPDGVSFPFEALLTDRNIQQPGYFLTHYATSYTYSARYLTSQFEVNASGSTSVMGMAPVAYNKRFKLADLPGSDISLQKINDYFKVTSEYVFNKATRSNFLENFPGYKIIQLYTHASANDTNNDPVIYFMDSTLSLSELIPDRKPQTQLVVLSACETAIGKFYEGEGIFSFNRGFAALGIPAAVSNLWSVENESTYRITELFYKYLSEELPTDVALQKAKLEFINTSATKEKKLPYFWAGPVLTGKVDTIKNEANFPWIPLSIVLVVVACGSYLLVSSARNRKAQRLNSPLL